MKTQKQTKNLNLPQVPLSEEEMLNLLSKLSDKDISCLLSEVF